MERAAKFHPGDVLTVIHGRLVSPNHMDGIYKLLEFITGAEIYSHQIPEPMTRNQSALIAQHPNLERVQIPVLNDEAAGNAFIAFDFRRRRRAQR